MATITNGKKYLTCTGEEIENSVSLSHTHGNSTILANTTASYTAAEQSKLAGLNDKFKGIFANATARDAALTSPIDGDYIKQTDTATIWFYAGGVWTDSGSSNVGDMIASIYDPQSLAKDAFVRSNHTGTLLATNIQCYPLLVQMPATALALTPGTTTTVPYTDAEVSMLGTNAGWTYESTNNLWIAPVTGTYHISANVVLDCVNNTPPTFNMRSQMNFRVWNTTPAATTNYSWASNVVLMANVSQYYFVGMSRTMQITAGHGIRVNVSNDNGASYVLYTTNNPDDNWMNIHLVGGIT